MKSHRQLHLLDKQGFSASAVNGSLHAIVWW